MKAKEVIEILELDPELEVRLGISTSPCTDTLDEVLLTEVNSNYKRDCEIARVKAEPKPDTRVFLLMTRDDF